ncbi:hypothetical protein RB599_004695 [Gaeumannomyces hyphopodioides]
MDDHTAGGGADPGAASMSTTQEPDMGHFARNDHELLVVKLLSLCIGAVSLAATIVTSYLFLRMRRSFRHDLVVLLLSGDFIKGICFVAYPITALASAGGPGAPIPADSAFCQLNGFLLTVGTEASDVAVLLIALHTVLYIVRPLPRRRGGGRGLYPFRRWAVATWILYPLVNASVAFAGGGGPPYEDTGEFCYLTVRERWYRSYLAWIPRYVIFSLIVVLYLGLFFFVRFSQWRYDRERDQAWQQDVTAPGSVPPTPPIERHGLIPEDETPRTLSRGATIDDDPPWVKSRQDSGVPLIKQTLVPTSAEQSADVKSPRASISSTEPEPHRHAEGRRVSFTRPIAERDTDSGTPRSPSGGATDLGKSRDRSPFRRVEWNWGGPSVAGSSGGGASVARPSFPSRNDRPSEPLSLNTGEPLSPLATETSAFIGPMPLPPSRPRTPLDGPGPSPRASVDQQAGQQRQGLRGQIEAQNRPSVPITAPPLPRLAATSSHKDLIAVLRAGPPRQQIDMLRSYSVASTNTAGERRPSTASVTVESRNTTVSTTRTSLFHSDLGVVPSRRRDQAPGAVCRDGSETTATRPATDDRAAGVTATRRMGQSRVRKRLRLLCVYPLLYVAMWLVPFVSHVLCYDGESEPHDASEPLWVLGLSVASLAAQGAINAALFSWRERPWRHRDPRDLWSRLCGRAATDWDRARCRCASWVRWVSATCCCGCRGRSKGPKGLERGFGKGVVAGGAAADLSGIPTRAGPAGSGRTRPEMVDDGRLARRRRQEEMRQEVERAAERARQRGPRYWWDVEADPNNLTSDDDFLDDQPGAGSRELSVRETSEAGPPEA